MSKQYVKCLTDELSNMTKGEMYKVSHIDPDDLFYTVNDLGEDDYWWLSEEDFVLVDKPKQSSRKCRPLTDDEKCFILDRPEQSSRSLAKQLWNDGGKRKSSINDFRKRVKENGLKMSVETDHLLKSEKNKERLMESVDEVKNTKPREQEEDINQRILLISDLHIPYHHEDALEFLQYLKDKYNPTRIISLGDELDKHALSFHDSDPDLPSAGDELRQSLPVIAELHTMFPNMDILDSNHGSLVYRKSKHHGIPRHYIKSYREVLEVGDGWTWHHDMTLDMPDGKKVYLCHGKMSDVTKMSQQVGMCAVAGHYHNAYKVEYWGNSFQLYWAMQAGCLINDKSLAFAYNKLTVKRPVIGTGLIIDGQPILEPLIMDDDGRWVGRKK